VPVKPKPFIVVVDDDEDAIFLFTHWIRRAGIEHPVFPILDGAEAIAFFEQAAAPEGGMSAPTMCFLDIKMSGRNGFDVLREIRSNEALDLMPVVILSSSDHRCDVVEATRLGAQCYLPKSVSGSILAETVRHAMEYVGGLPREPAAFPFKANLMLGAQANRPRS
jgi:two-component system, chemotaxis family, response regulator Rcp1